MSNPAPPRVPPAVLDVMRRLWDAGHAAYIVGGGVRDDLLDRPVKDWDAATDALPEAIQAIFPGAQYENRFGTVTVATDGGPVQITTFRRDHIYGDHRRPQTVTFTDSLQEDLIRRDFTVNAIAWGRRGGSEKTSPVWVDPTGGLADLDARLLRAVGDPVKRFDEDALRLMRAARLAAQLEFEIEAATRMAMAECAATIKWVSDERIGDEMRRMLDARPPSRGFEVLAETGILEHSLPELSAQRGIPQDKVAGMDLWRHSMATLDAAAEIDPGNERLRLAALLHDIGKPSTFADGHFIGHDQVGAGMALELMARLASRREDRQRVERLIRHHMFSYESRWTAAAVRRFIRRVGRDLIDDLLKLRAADNVGSGLPADAGNLDELRRRVASELSSGMPLTLSDLAIDGNDLVGEVTQRPGVMVGWLLKHLLDWVTEDPARNNRAALLDEARTERARVKAL
jgi:putative nucleotidyltransferase with HDIG domain